MPLTLNCPKCHKPFRVRDESIGQRVKCPSCGAILHVPSTLSPVSQAGDGSGEQLAPDDFSESSKPLAGAAPPRLPKPMTSTPSVPSLDQMLAAGGGIKRPKPGDEVDLGATDPSALPAPPSIKMGAPPPRPSNPQNIPEPNRDRPTGTRAAGVSPPAVSPTTSVLEHEKGWKKTRSALGWIRFGFLLLCVPVLLAGAEAIFTGLDSSGDLAPFLTKPGYTVVKEEPFSPWKPTFLREITYATFFVFGLLFGLLNWIGRAKLLSLPAPAKGKGLALASWFFFTIGIVAAIAAPILLSDFRSRWLPTLEIPAETQPIVLTVAVGSFLISETCLMLTLVQAGWAIGRAKISSELAFTAFLIVAPLMGLFITNLFFPILPVNESLVQRQEALNEKFERVFYLSAIMYGLCVVWIFRWIGTIGVVKKAIKKALTPA